uniref:tetratricopeptide repeat protein n=1 Tax=Ningiella ruwaisensis TaxID=2364274 RepID=UPI001F4F5D1F|nr:tetratricopeptide repeat protein [Ningiella ruwaisensis]
MKNYCLTLFFGLLMSQSVLAQTSVSFDKELLNIQHEWARVNYTLADDAQEKGFEALVNQVKAFQSAYPERAEPFVWYGIIESSYAGAKGGLGALSHAKQAKKWFEKALEIDESALDGSAYTSLGVLYHKVPGWPIAFGDDDEAKALLEKALAMNPTGIDPNYFYAEFLFDEGQYEKAKAHLLLALQAPARPERPLADESRRAEVQTLLAKTESKSKK